MVDAMLIFLTCVVILISLMVFVGNIYVLAYFSHPEDNITNGIWYYRGLVILALSFAQYIIFAIPLDISSAERSDSIGLNFPMDIIWSIIDFVVCASVMFFLPLALVIYTNIETSIVSLRLKLEINLKIEKNHQIRFEVCRLCSGFPHFLLHHLLFCLW